MASFARIIFASFVYYIDIINNILHFFMIYMKILLSNNYCFHMNKLTSIVLFTLPSRIDEKARVIFVNVSRLNFQKTQIFSKHFLSD